MPAPAPTKETAPPTVDENMVKVTCTKGKEARLLEVIKKDNGCAFAYTKNGKINEAASSIHGFKHCKDSEKKVQGKLESAGYACKS